jgi:hypothetical protein
MKHVLHKLWTEEHPLIALISTGLMAMAFSGIGFMVFQLITNPSQFDNVTFGLIDYI